MDPMSLRLFLAGNRYGVVSSIAEDGTPQSALVGIAISPELEIIFDTLKSSRKYRNLIARPDCSFVVGWSAEQTVQYEGIAKIPHGSDLEHFQSIYCSTWPEGRTRLQSPEIIYFVVKPIWIRYSDYAQIPVMIEEIAFNS